MSLQSETCIKILNVLENTTFMALHKLASAINLNPRSSDFKLAIANLKQQGILKEVRGGWRSESRNTHNHPRVVILCADLWRFGSDRLETKSLNLPLKDLRFKRRFPSLEEMEYEEELNRNLKVFLEKIEDCPDCKSKPYVYLGNRKIPLCQKHWEKLADTDIEWNQDLEA